MQYFPRVRASLYSRIVEGMMTKHAFVNLPGQGAVADHGWRSHCYPAHDAPRRGPSTASLPSFPRSRRRMPMPSNHCLCRIAEQQGLRVPEINPGT